MTSAGQTDRSAHLKNADKKGRGAATLLYYNSSVTNAGGTGEAYPADLY